MLKKILFGLSKSIIKLILPFFSNLFIKLKINKRIANYLNEKSFFANNYYNFSDIIEKKLKNKKIVSLDIGAQGGFNSDIFFPEKYNKFFESILVEPIKKESEKLIAKNNQVIDKGIWSERAKKKIYIRANFPHPLESYVRISLGSAKKMAIFYNTYIKWKKSNFI